jgi:hypothetical protein
MLIQKQLTGEVWLIENGSIVASILNDCTINCSYKRAGLEVIDESGRRFIIELGRVDSTQVLPAAAVPFTGDLDSLYTLLVTSFLSDDVTNLSTVPGANVTQALDNLAAGDIDNIGNWIWISSKDDFPAAVAGVITLEANKTYVLVGDIDLTGDRVVTSGYTTIIGGSSETSSITSTGLSASLALIESEWTIAMRHFTIKDVTEGVKVSGVTNAPVALDWTGLNFLNVSKSATINTCSNFIYSKSALLNSRGLSFTGTVGTIGIDNSLLLGDGAAGNIVEILAGCTISRRFRIIYSSIVAFGSSVGINVDAAASVPVEGYILDTVAFSGGGTYQTGVLYTNNKALFVNCTGITNTGTLLNYYMANNATATVIGSAGVAVKIAGTTTETSLTQKFTHTDNRGTYTGALTVDLLITCVVSFSTGNNNEVGVYISKNGTLIVDSEMYATANASGKAESIAIQTLTTAVTNDYFEIWIENETAANNITVEYLNVIIRKL